MAFSGFDLVRCKLVLDGKITTQVKLFKFFDVSLSPFDEINFMQKIEEFNTICETISRTLRNKV